MTDGQRQFWIAVHNADGAVVFGPFAQLDIAIDQREAMQRAYPEKVVSGVYSAGDRESAELNARFYLPEV